MYYNNAFLQICLVMPEKMQLKTYKRATSWSLHLKARVVQRFNSFQKQKPFSAFVSHTFSWHVKQKYAQRYYLHMIHIPWLSMTFLKLFKTLGLAITFKNFKNFPCFMVYLHIKQFNKQYRLWCPPKCVPLVICSNLSIKQNFKIPWPSKTNN